jgi:hypothetical protein
MDVGTYAIGRVQHRIYDLSQHSMLTFISFNLTQSGGLEGQYIEPPGLVCSLPRHMKEGSVDSPVTVTLKHRQNVESNRQGFDQAKWRNPTKGAEGTPQ